MQFWVIFIIIGVVVALIWIFSKWNGLKSKLLAVFIITLVLLALFSFIVVFKDRNISIKNLSDLKGAAQLYFAWLVNAFSNVKTITTQTINMDWKGNQTT